MLKQINFSFRRPIRLIAALCASLVLAGMQTSYAAENSAAAPASGSIDGAFEGQTQATTAPVAGTDEVPVYQTVRFNFDGYYLKVPNGTYTVTLKFVEPFYDKPGARVFGVKIQEKQVIETLDIYAKAGKNQAIDFTFKDIEVKIGALRIDFTRKVEFPCIAGIVIDGTTKAGQPFTRKINCGGHKFKDYEADRVANWASGGYHWPSASPTNCPFKQSSSLNGIVFTGRHAEYTGADTWYPSWASDDKMYSSWTDGEVNGLDSLSGGENSRTGYATILGNDPLHLQVVDQGVYKSDPSPYLGRYPCGTLVYNGVWYYGTYGLHPSGDVKHEGIVYNWPWLGPLVGFRYSTDFGKTWTQTPCTPEKPLFGEHALHGEPVKFGAPHFVDFGKNMEHSPDGKAYIVGHGASDGTNRRFGYNSWITGDEIYIARVTPGIENMNDMSKYEFFDGSGWTKDFSKTKPIAAWRDHMGCVTMTYNAPLKKYLMCVTDGGNTTGFYSTYILESDTITGPFKMAQYLYHFGEQAYFVNIPSKFISADGLTLWLCYAANFAPEWNGVKIKANPPGSRYGMCLQEIRLNEKYKSVIVDLKVTPESRRKDIILPAGK